MPVPCRQGGLSSHDKYVTWEEIKVLTFTRAIAASWMVSLLDLMTRVQLNILGRRLYLQSNVLDARYLHDYAHGYCHAKVFCRGSAEIVNAFAQALLCLMHIVNVHCELGQYLLTCPSSNALVAAQSHLNAGTLSIVGLAAGSQHYK